MNNLRSFLPHWEHSESDITDDVQTRKSIYSLAETTICAHWHTLVEDYRPGYPRFTALLSAYDPYFLCRRFSKLRARLLLLKQDRLSVLEQKLEQVDHEETSPLFLGKSRCDRNPERISLLSDIESCLANYGKGRSQRSISNTNRIQTNSPRVRTRC